MEIRYQGAFDRMSSFQCWFEYTLMMQSQNTPYNGFKARTWCNTVTGRTANDIYILRILTETEQRYSNIGYELLAAVSILGRLKSLHCRIQSYKR